MQSSDKKTSALGGDGAKVIVTAKTGIFFRDIRIKAVFD